MMRAFLAWLDDRTGCNDLVKETLYERIPGGARWRYVWGSTLVFTFTIQVITGIFLWTAYSPSAQTAWESVYFIQEKMFLGWLVRGIHHFAAQAMTVLLAIHLIQVIIDGAYKAPREVNFWLGLILMKIVLALGLTGYLLPWDQKGYYATKVTTNIMDVLSERPARVEPHTKTQSHEESALTSLCLRLCVRLARESAKLYELLSHDETDWLPVVPPRTPV